MRREHQELAAMPVIGSERDFKLAVQGGKLLPDEDGWFDKAKVREMFPAVGAPPRKSEDALRPAPASEINRAIATVYDEAEGEKKKPRRKSLPERRYRAILSLWR